MVANLSSHKAGIEPIICSIFDTVTYLQGWDERWKEFSDWAKRGQDNINALHKLVDEDTYAFQQIQSSFGLPRGSPEEIAKRYFN